jgi:hypothetical protein
MLVQFQRLALMAKEDLRRLRKEKVRAVALYAVAGVFGLTAYACLVVALVLWIARNSSPLAAAVIAAVGFAVLAGILIAIVAALGRAEQRRRERRADIYAATLRSAAGSAMVGMLMRPKGLAAAAAVMVAGLAFGLFRGPGPRDR